MIQDRTFKNPNTNSKIPETIVKLAQSNSYLPKPTGKLFRSTSLFKPETSFRDLHQNIFYIISSGLCQDLSSRVITEVKHLELNQVSDGSNLLGPVHLVHHSDL